MHEDSIGDKLTVTNPVDCLRSTNRNLMCEWIYIYIYIYNPF